VRIATWNVNSLKARMDRVMEWLERAEPDVLLMQETKLADDDAPLLPFSMRGYELVHHGEGRWNGVAIASRLPIDPGSVISWSACTHRTAGWSARRRTTASCAGMSAWRAGSTRPPTRQSRSSLAAT